MYLQSHQRKQRPMKHRSYNIIRAAILVLSISTLSSGFLLSGAFKSILAHGDDYIYDYYGDCTEAVEAERAKWDADGDGEIGLAEAIQALRITAGYH